MLDKVYDLLRESAKEFYQQVIICYFMSLGVHDPSQDEFQLSEILDMAYCIAHDFEVLHPDWITYFRRDDNDSDES